MDPNIGREVFLSDPRGALQASQCWVGSGCRCRCVFRSPRRTLFCILWDWTVDRLRFPRWEQPEVRTGSWFAWSAVVLWFLVFGVWYLVSGFWFLPALLASSGIWLLASCLGPLVTCLWCLPSACPAHPDDSDSDDDGDDDSDSDSTAETCLAWLAARGLVRLPSDVWRALVWRCASRSEDRWVALRPTGMWLSERQGD